jgi:hypothetical protein
MGIIFPASVISILGIGDTLGDTFSLQEDKIKSIKKNTEIIFIASKEFLSKDKDFARR